MSKLGCLTPDIFGDIVMKVSKGDINSNQAKELIKLYINMDEKIIDWDKLKKNIQRINK